MKLNRLMWVVIVCLFAGIELWAQQLNTPSEGLGSNPSNAVNVPRLIKFSGAMKDFTGKPLMGPVDINFAIYKQQTDAEPVWQEMQTLQLDEQGRYTVLLGAMQPEGLPMELFSSGQARWLEVNAAGTELQPRTLLVSVPYALKASDAETLGGKPASAYLLAPVNQTGSGTTQATKGSSTAATGNTTILAPVITPNVITATQNYIPVLTDNSGDMGNSTMYQFGTQVGIATTTPGTLNGHYFPSLLLDAAQATASTYLTADTELQGGYAGILLNRGAATANNRDWAIENQPDATLTSSQLAISTYNDAGYPTAMLMVTRSGLVGIGTTTPAATLEVNGTGKFDGGVAVAGLTVGNCVQAGAGGFLTTTASPCGSGGGGGGSITGVTAGADLTGGGTSGVVTLNLDTTRVPTLAASSNTFTGEQLVTVSAGTAIFGGSNSGNGVIGQSNAAAYPAIGGFAPSGGRAFEGLAGITSNTYSNPAGVYGEGYTGGNGVMGVSSTTSYSGVFGVNAGGGEAITGVNNSASYPTLVLNNDAASGSALIFEGLAPNYSDDGCAIYTNGNVVCTGTKSAVVPIAGARKVALYAVEAPDVWFEDFGSGKLETGVATIALDPVFLQTVNANLAYHVFLTPGGDCKGLYVAQKTPTSFQVRELGGGESSVEFDYRIVARRKGYETTRLEDMTGKFPHAAAQKLATSPQSVLKR